jgi:hypothetical protein
MPVECATPAAEERAVEILMLLADHGRRSAGLTDLRRPALLDPARHDRTRFDSGEPALDDWLRRYAGQNRRRDTRGDVDHRHSRGSEHLRPCDRDRAERDGACRAVVVAALDARARVWWEPLGFHPFDPNDPTETDPYLLTSEIEATLGQLAR